MAQGRTLQELAAEIERQQESKKDFIVPAVGMVFRTSSDGETMMGLGTASDGGVIYGTTPLFRDQVQTYIGFPKQFAERLRTSHPDIYDTTTERLLHETGPRRMVRTLDGKARAFLSNRYRRLDYYDLIEAVLPVLGKIEDVSVESCQITESKLYIKAVSRRLTGEVKVGQVVQSGVIISTSEVGLAPVVVDPWILTLACMNGMVVSGTGIRARHIGKRLGDGTEDAMELWSDATLQADDRAFWMKVRDVVSATVDETVFRRVLDQAKRAAGIELEEPVEVVELIGSRLQLTEDERGGVLKHLVAGGDLSAWGAVSAVTALARETEDYDRATELERGGGDLLLLPQSDWRAAA